MFSIVPLTSSSPKVVYKISRLLFDFLKSSSTPKRLVFFSNDLQKGKINSKGRWALIMLRFSSVWLSMSICFDEELSFPALLSSISSKCVDYLPSFCVPNRIKVDKGPSNLFCSISTPEGVDILASWNV